MKNYEPSHDFLHVKRVLKLAKIIGERENADMKIVIPAVLLHDIAIQDKSSKETRIKSAEKSKQMAKEILEKHNFEKIDKILYAIDVHSFSKGIEPETLEAKILQDADRLDALGAVGIARLFSVCGALKRKFYNEQEEMLDDAKYGLDHVYIKLLKLKMNMSSSEKIAKERREFLLKFIEQFKNEI